MKYFDVVANRRACLWREGYLAETTKSTNRKMEQRSAGGEGGGMTSSNLKIGAKLSHGVVAVLKNLHFALP